MTKKQISLFACTCGIAVVHALVPFNQTVDTSALAGKLGVFTHYLPNCSLVPRIPEFEEEALVRQIVETGADHYGITLGQYNNAYCSPNAAYDRAGKHVPGTFCSTRDIPAALAPLLARHNIKFMLYLPSEPSGNDQAAVSGFGFEWDGQRGDRPYLKTGVQGWAKAIEEWSRRYGRNVFAWWFDGAYPRWGFSDGRAAVYKAAAKSGNPDALVTFNNGRGAVPWTSQSDYTAGEVNNPFSAICSGPFVDGRRWHVLTPLGQGWCRRGLRFSDEEWIRWLARILANGGSVTFDVAVSTPAGVIAPEHIAQLKRIFAGARAAAVRPLPPLTAHDQAALASMTRPSAAWFGKGMYIALEMPEHASPEQALVTWRESFAEWQTLGPNVRLLMPPADYQEPAFSTFMRLAEEAQMQTVPCVDAAAFKTPDALGDRLVEISDRVPLYGFAVSQADRFPLAAWERIRSRLDQVRRPVTLVGDSACPEAYVNVFAAKWDKSWRTPGCGIDVPAFRNARQKIVASHPVGTLILPGPAELPAEPELRKTALGFLFHFVDLPCLSEETIAKHRVELKTLMASRQHHPFSYGTILWLDNTDPESTLSFRRSGYHSRAYTCVFRFEKEAGDVHVTHPDTVPRPKSPVYRKENSPYRVDRAFTFPFSDVGFVIVCEGPDFG